MPSHYSNAASSAYAGYKRGRAISNAAVQGYKKGNQIGEMATTGAYGASQYARVQQGLAEATGKGLPVFSRASEKIAVGIAKHESRALFNTLRAQQSRIHEARNTPRVGMYRDADPQTPYVSRAFQR